MDSAPSPRLVPTAPGWAAIALADPEALLSDHAHCEKKAAAVALSLLGTSVDDPDAVMRLARYKLPEAVIVVEQLPLTTVAKIDRSALAELVRDEPVPDEP